MNRKRLICFLLGIFLLSPATLAYDGPGFTVDVPPELGNCITPSDGVLFWQMETGENLNIVVSENSDKLNLYDMEDSDTSELTEDLGAEIERQIRDAYAGMDDETLRQIEPKVTSMDGIAGEAGGEPCLYVKISIDLQLDGNTVLTMYERQMIRTSKAHLFTLTYTCYDETEIEEASQPIFDSFVITEPCYTGETFWLAALDWGDILRDGLIGAFIGLAAGGVWSFLSKRKKKAAQQKLPNELPENSEAESQGDASENALK